MTDRRGSQSSCVEADGSMSPRWSAIRRMVEQIVERFGPEKIVLFGSHAYGQPNCDSDVDVLVVMSTKNQVEQACRIRLAVEHPFPLDLLVRTPEYLKARVEAGDCFLQEILSEGVVLYERTVAADFPAAPGSCSKRHRGKPQAARSHCGRS